MQEPLLSHDRSNPPNKNVGIEISKDGERETTSLTDYLFERYLSRLNYHYLSVENVLERDPLFYDIICQHISMLSHSINIDYNIGFLSIADGNLFHDLYFPVSYENTRHNTRSKMGGTSILFQNSNVQNSEAGDEAKIKATYIHEAEKTKMFFHRVQYLIDDYGIKVIIETYVAILSLIKYYHDVQNLFVKSNARSDIDPSLFSSKDPFNDVHKEARIHSKSFDDYQAVVITENSDKEEGEESHAENGIANGSSSTIEINDYYKEKKFKYCCCCRCGKKIITYPLEENLFQEIYLLLSYMEFQISSILDDEEREEDF